MGRLARDEFEVLVGEALDELPPDLMKAISNVQVTIQDLPGSEAAGAQIAPNALLLGLYTGIPLTQRGMGYAGVLPDRITIYQDNIERVAATPEAIRAQVRQTVLHEVAHHFGISDERLSELGW